MATLGWISFAELRDAYEEAARGLLDGGVDLFIIETCQDLLQAKAAMIGARRAMKAAGRAGADPDVQVTMETTGRMLLGTEIGAALASLGAMRPDVFGLNCATGPKEMHEHLRHLSRYSPIPISCVPNAGLPSIVDGHTHYDLTPEQLADAHAHNVTELGISVVGGCCGTTPGAPQAVVEQRARASRRAARTPIIEPSVSSLFSAVPLRQETSYLVIGERTNANGSKAFRDALLDGGLGRLRGHRPRAGQGRQPRHRRVRRLRRPRRRAGHERAGPALRRAHRRRHGARLHRART